MARALWKAYISFGMVDVPVKLYTAVRPQTISFVMLHDQDEVRIQQKMVCPKENREVPREHMLRGYEIAKDRYVVVNDEELEAAQPLPSREIKVSTFVDPDEIDPMYYERAYYLGPDTHGAKAYSLLLAALKKVKKVAIVQFVMRGKEYLGAIRVLDNLLCLETMRYDDEVLPGPDDEELDRPKKMDEREIKMAQHLVDALSGRFGPEKYKDEYRDCVLEMVRRKAHGEKIDVKPVRAPKSTDDNNLMKALQASVTALKGKAPKTSGKRPARRRSARA